MNSSIYKRSQLKYLSATLGCSPKELEYIISNLDAYYREWHETKINGATGDFKRYRDGTIKQRTIRPSIKRLKVLQGAIKNKILAPILLPENIHGGVKKKNNISNAKPHQGKKFTFTTDLQEFYPGIKYNSVYSLFLRLGYSNHIAHWLTKLTTWKHELPQGTPTSPHIANLAFLPTDYKLIELCATHGLTYTRYVDDLTFSSDKDFKPITNDILKIILDDGYKISRRKTSYKALQTITGIKVFNNRIDAPEKIIRKAEEELANDSIMKPFTNYLRLVRKTN